MIVSPFLTLFIMGIVLKTSQPVAVVKSNSMYPDIKRGDMVLASGIKNSSRIKECSAGKNDGDIIIFNASGLWRDAPNDPIVHRVISKWKNGSDWYYLTKGDANPSVDKAPIPKNRILGKVTRVIPYVGWGKIILMQLSFILQMVIFFSIMITLAIKFKKLKFK